MIHYDQNNFKNAKMTSQSAPEGCPSRRSTLIWWFCFFPARDKANWKSQPFCSFPAREKQIGSLNHFVFFSRPGKKQIGSLNNFAFSGPGKKQIWSLNQIAFSRAGKKQIVSLNHFVFSRPGKKQIRSLNHFACSRPGNKQIGSLNPFAFSRPVKTPIGSLNHGREKSNSKPEPKCFFPAREKTNWKSEPEPFAFSRPGKSKLEVCNLEVWTWGTRHHLIVGGTWSHSSSHRMCNLHHGKTPPRVNSCMNSFACYSFIIIYGGCSKVLFFSTFRRTFAKLSQAFARGALPLSAEKKISLGLETFKDSCCCPSRSCVLWSLTHWLLRTRKLALSFWCRFGWEQPSINKTLLRPVYKFRLPICFFPSREKAKWFRLPNCFFPGREKTKWFRLPICFLLSGYKQVAYACGHLHNARFISAASCARFLRLLTRFPTKIPVIGR